MTTLLLLITAAFAEPEVHAEATAQWVPLGATSASPMAWSPQTVVLDVRGRLDGENDGYLLGAARVDASGWWLGRAGVGIDVFGDGEKLDLKLGLFLGGTGNVFDSSFVGRPAAGAEVQVGTKVGRVLASYRHLDGFAGPLEDRLTENELRVGFEVSENLRVHGQYVWFNPGSPGLLYTGAGIGAEVVF